MTLWISDSGYQSCVTIEMSLERMRPQPSVAMVSILTPQSVAVRVMMASSVQTMYISGAPSRRSLLPKVGVCGGVDRVVTVTVAE